MENFYDLSKQLQNNLYCLECQGRLETILISEGVSKTDIVEFYARSHFDAEVTKATAIATAFSNVRSDIESATVIKRDA